MQAKPEQGGQVDSEATAELMRALNDAVEFIDAFVSFKTEVSVSSKTLQGSINNLQKRCDEQFWSAKENLTYLDQLIDKREYHDQQAEVKLKSQVASMISESHLTEAREVVLEDQYDQFVPAEDERDQKVNQSNLDQENQPDVYLFRAQKYEGTIVYHCGMCLGRFNKSMYTHPQPYLQHLEQVHSISKPDLKRLILSSLQQGCKIPISHAFWEGELTSVAKNNTTRFDGDLIYYLWRTQQYPHIYVCGCLFPSDTRIIFSSGKAYAEHVFSQHSGTAYPNSSHKVQIKNGVVTFYHSANKSFYKSTQFYRLVKIIEKTYNKPYLLSKLPGLICRKINLKQIQFMSKHPELVPLMPFETVPLSIETQKTYRKIHYKPIMLRKILPAQLQGSELMRRTAQRYFSLAGPKAYKRKAIIAKGLSAEENMMLNLELWLQQNIKFCAECKCFFEESFAYITHILKAHPSIHPNNSHTFKFLMKQEMLRDIFYDY